MGDGARVEHQVPRGRVVQLEEVQHAVHDLRSEALEGSRVQKVVEEHLHQLQQRMRHAERLQSDDEARTRADHVVRGALHLQTRCLPMILSRQTDPRVVVESGDLVLQRAWNERRLPHLLVEKTLQMHQLVLVHVLQRVSRLSQQRAEQELSLRPVDATGDAHEVHAMVPHLAQVRNRQLRVQLGARLQHRSHLLLHLIPRVCVQGLQMLLKSHALGGGDPQSFLRLVLLSSRGNGCEDVVADGDDASGSRGCPQELLAQHVQRGEEILVRQLLQYIGVGRSVFEYPVNHPRSRTQADGLDAIHHFLQLLLRLLSVDVERLL